MKYESKQFDGDLKEGIEIVEQALSQYQANLDDEKKFIRLKEAIYDLSLTIKHEVVNGELNPGEAEFMKQYFWGLL